MRGEAARRKIKEERERKSEERGRERIHKKDIQCTPLKGLGKRLVDAKVSVSFPGHLPACHHR